jgi:hypothetical protein
MRASSPTATSGIRRRAQPHLAREKQVTFAIQREPQRAPPVSSTKTPLYQAMEGGRQGHVSWGRHRADALHRRHDGAELRAAGIPTYGFFRCRSSKTTSCACTATTSACPCHRLAGEPSTCFACSPRLR